MKRLILVLFLSVQAIIGMAQKKYILEFSDSIITILPDSILKELSKMPNQQGIELTPDLMEQFFTQLKTMPLSMYQLRTVTATKDRTIVKIDRSSRSGNTINETFDSLLYKNDELFPDSASSSGFSVLPISTTRKNFLSTENSKVIMNYKCKEYISTDSTCRIWVTTELPDYVNPGIRKGNIKGAVLGFELKANIIVTRSFLTRFGKSL